jgi:general secretion pathway protein D
MLLQNGDATILMNSKLTTTNNREASLHIGEIVPYTIQAYNMGGSGGMGGNLQIMKENVGLIVTMTPHVNDDNQITLALAPEVSNIVDWKGEYSDIPLVRTRKTNTTIRVENGQKVLLAGLLSEEEVLTTHKVPILGDIPVLGLLFQNRREQTIRKNLIIEVIPRIIKDPNEIEKYLKSSSNSGTPPGTGNQSRSTQKNTPAGKVQSQPVTGTRKEETAR